MLYWMTSSWTIQTGIKNTSDTWKKETKELILEILKEYEDAIATQEGKNNNQIEAVKEEQTQISTPQIPENYKVMKLDSKYSK